MTEEFCCCLSCHPKLCGDLQIFFWWRDTEIKKSFIIFHNNTSGQVGGAMGLIRFYFVSVCVSSLAYNVQTTCFCLRGICVRNCGLSVLRAKAANIIGIDLSKAYDTSMRRCRKVVLPRGMGIWRYYSFKMILKPTVKMSLKFMGIFVW